MIRILGVVLVIVGAWLLYTGYSRGRSLAGKTRSNIAQLKNEIDGKARVPDHVWYYVGGGLVVLVGGALVIRKH
jgi:hypothetical protein